MYQSKVLEKFLVKEVEEKSDKEIQIQNVIKELNVHPDDYKDVKAHSFLKALFIFALVTTAVMSLFLLTDMFIGKENAIYNNAVSYVALIVFCSFCSFMMSFGERNSQLHTNEKNKKKRDQFDENLTELFYLLSETPYEFRAKTEMKDEKWATKVVVESNIIKEGGHVIKDKTQHFTSYINPLAGSKSVIAHLTEIVKKAEQFK